MYTNLESNKKLLLQNLSEKDLYLMEEENAVDYAKQLIQDVNLYEELAFGLTRYNDESHVDAVYYYDKNVNSFRCLFEMTRTIMDGTNFFASNLPLTVFLTKICCHEYKITGVSRIERSTNCFTIYPVYFLRQPFYVKKFDNVCTFRFLDF